MKNSLRHTIYLVVGSVMFLLASLPADAAQITSADFSIGLSVASFNTWSTLETAGSNTATTLGDFSFSPSATSVASLSGTGTGFSGRVLSDNGSFSTYAGPAGGKFGTSIVASYNGAAPLDAAAIPNYRIMVEITSISIYGMAYGGSTSTLNWDESTPGHIQASPVLNLPAVPPPGNTWEIASNYSQLVWDAPDFSTALAGLNDSATRMFDIQGSSTLKPLDGLEVEGRVHLVYDVAVPSGPACGDVDHPYPAGDVNLDCYVDINDLVDIAATWLSCTDPEPPCSYLP